MTDFLIFCARLMMGVPFIIWGVMKLRGGEAHLEPALKALGLHDVKALAYLVGFCEFIGGLGVVIGWPVHLFSAALGLWCLATGVVSHKTDRTALLEHITMAGGFFLLAAVGAGAYRLF